MVGKGIIKHHHLALEFSMLSYNSKYFLKKCSLKSGSWWQA